MAHDEMKKLSKEQLKVLKDADLAIEAIADEHHPAEKRLVLRDLKNAKVLPLAVDFLAPTLLHRLRHGLGKTQPMPKALGLKSLDPAKAPYVLDATAGQGVDALLIAAHGCRVRSIERSPFIFALLQDGYDRLQRYVDASKRLAGGGVDHSVKLFPELISRLSFEHGDALEVIRGLKPDERPDVIYMDPMYPEETRSKTALPKKGMQLFRRLIGDDLDAEEMLEIALKQAKDRVVVKRPVRAPPLLRKPSHEFLGKTARFDMYLCERAGGSAPVDFTEDDSDGSESDETGD